MFTQVLSGRIYNQLKDGSQLRNKENVVHIIEYYSAVKRKGIGVPFTMRMGQGDTLNESHQQQKDTR